MIICLEFELDVFHFSIQLKGVDVYSICPCLVIGRTFLKILNFIPHCASFTSIPLKLGLSVVYLLVDAIVSSYCLANFFG